MRHCNKITWTVAWAAAIMTSAGWAGRPLAIDDAGPVAPWQVEVEAGATYVADGPMDHFDFPFGVAAGLPGHFELGFGFGGQLEEREDAVGRRHLESGIGDLTLGAKWQFLQADRFWADQAVAGTVKLPTADDDREFGSGITDYDLTWIVTKALSEKWNAHFNLGYTWVGGTDDVLHYGVAADYLLTDRMQLVAEVFADTTEDDTAVQAGGGLRWQVWEPVVLDAAVGAKLHGDAPDWTATIGLTWTLDFNRKETK